MKNTMNEHIRQFMAKVYASDAYNCMKTYRPQGNEQKVEILEGVK